MTSYNLRPLGVLSVAELRRPDTGLNRTDLDVLRALVTFWNCRDIRPSHAVLAERAGVSKRTVVGAIRHLREAGALRLTTGATGGACRYSLNLSAVLTEAGFNLADIPSGWYAGYKPAPAAGDPGARADIKPLTPVPSRVSEEVIAEQSAKRIARQKAEAEEEAAEKARLAEFNAAYPRGAALPNQWAAARRHAAADTLVRAAKVYAAQCKRRGTQERYITLARNWLRNHAWEDALPNGGEIELTGSTLRALPGGAQVAMSRAERDAEDGWDKEHEDIIHSGGLTGPLYAERSRRARDARRAAAANWIAAHNYDGAAHLN